MENVSISSQASNEFYSLWQNRHFDSCVEELQRLERGNPQDPKVLHNNAIADFCRGGWKNSEDVLRTLVNAKVTLERNYWDTAEATAVTGAYLAAAEMSVVSLNMAIVHYHRNEVPEALALLEPLFACIGPLDDGTAFRVCLLLLDIYILSEDYQKAKSVLGFLEKTHGNLFNPDDREAGCEQLIDGDKEQIDGNSTVLGQIGDSSSSNTDESEEACADARLLGLPALSKMGLVPLQLGPKNGDARHDKERCGALDLKIHVHLYRVKLLLAMKNIRTAKREFRCIQSAAPTNITALFMKAQLHVLQGKLKKGAQILSRCVEGTPEPSSHRVAALCNMGVIYHQMKKHNSACLCFSNALKQLAEIEATGISAEISLPNPGIIQEEELQLLYNAGLQHLLLKRYSLALDCFREVAVLMFNKASLWLRMAECCLGMYHAGAPDRHTGSKPVRHPDGPVIAKVVAEKGLPQVFVLPEGTNGLFISKEDNSILSEANSYLQNACYLLKQQEDKFSAAHSDLVDEELLGSMQALPGQGSSASKESHILQSAMCKMAYINLQLEQPERAYAAIEPLLQQPVLDKAVALLVNCYASEALCLMNRPSEAADQLGMFMARLEDYETEPDTITSQEGENDNSEAQDSLHSREVYLSGPGARASLYVNLGSVYATQGNLLQAQQCARKAMAYHPNSIHAVLILVYAELAKGNKDAALALMKREKRVH